MTVRTMMVEVRRYIDVTVDESKFTNKFLAEFRKDFFPFYSLDDHVKHLAQLYAIGAIGEYPPDQFVEGYGPLDQMGISCCELAEIPEPEILEDDGEDRP